MQTFELIEIVILLCSICGLASGVPQSSGQRHVVKIPSDSGGPPRYLSIHISEHQQQQGGQGYGGKVGQAQGGQQKRGGGRRSSFGTPLVGISHSNINNLNLYHGGGQSQSQGYGGQRQAASSPPCGQQQTSPCGQQQPKPQRKRYLIAIPIPSRPASLCGQQQGSPCGQQQQQQQYQPAQQQFQQPSVQQLIYPQQQPQQQQYQPAQQQLQQPLVQQSGYNSQQQQLQQPSQDFPQQPSDQQFSYPQQQLSQDYPKQPDQQSGYPQQQQQQQHPCCQPKPATAPSFYLCKRLKSYTCQG